MLRPKFKKLIWEKNVLVILVIYFKTHHVLSIFLELKLEILYYDFKMYLS